MKTILVPTERYDSMPATLETALLLARKFDSYVEGFAPRFAITNIVAMDVTSSVPIATFEQENQEAARQAHEVFEGFMGSRGVAPGTSPGALSYGWLDEAPEGEFFIGSYGRVFDITVVGRPGTDLRGPNMSTLEAALFESGHPILIAPPTAPTTLGDNVLIAWNGSTEQSTTNAHAMPLLRKAGKVTVLTVESAMAPGPSGDKVVRYLAGHGVAAEHVTLKTNDKHAGDVILKEAKARGCDLVVKGAYTQSRLRQMIFGGTTRHILFNATIPVLMAH